MFTIIGLVAPDDPNAASQPYRFGVVDEAGKINVNALLALDNGKGDVGIHQILMALPNMTDDVANSILDWLDPDDTPRTDGAEDDYYSSLPIRRITARTGRSTAWRSCCWSRASRRSCCSATTATATASSTPTRTTAAARSISGWSAYLTVYSREPNIDVQRQRRAFTSTTPTSTRWPTT